jgi:SAM-dependent methyltransferase
LRKTKVEKIFDKYAKGYSSGDFAPLRYDTARTAMSFADDITWHFLTKHLPKRKSIKILDAGSGDGYWAQKLVELGYKNVVVMDVSQNMLGEAARASLDTKFRRVPELVEAGKIDEAEKLLETNISYESDFPQYDLTWEELSDFFLRAGLTVIEVVGAPVFMHQVDGRILKRLEADPKIRSRLLQIELAHCTDRSLVNFAGHLQAVGQKP